MKRRHFLLSGLAAGIPLSGVARADTPPQAEGHVGATNSLTDVTGLSVGQAQSPGARTGVTVILPDSPAPCAVDVRGGGPGTRETDALNGWNLVHRIDALTLSGGSVYGLAAADGVAAWLGARGRGFAMRRVKDIPVSPIVPAAILYDLDNGGDKSWGETPPYRALGIEAVSQARRSMALGTVGAGYGAMAGQLKGGIGSASWVSHDGYTVAAIVATNSLGSVTLPHEKHFWAAPFEQGREFGGLGVSTSRIAPEDWSGTKLAPAPRANTTLACIATDAALTQEELKRIAMMAQDGLARAIHPVHSPFDGDTIFALATGHKSVPDAGRELLVTHLGSIAADVLARAVARGVYSATQPPGMNAPLWSALPG
ncbi:P1 family peptidase [Asaia siamensis]|uniref:Peptidase T4 n=1 Tax=Asaia siamensis TaxID=110479 RepID=A0ABQ1L749_9PROT|nr:P1 family peptidase [Asaia siamensis]GBR09235.1 peptidase S58 DmpA [Asaia siamensis NRIC 0323]GGC20558.1 peptidase T4 [Asaia siamensis]